jgi:2-dehydropantoate 2-reductase
VDTGKWPAIAVVGAGAVGCYFGGILARAGAPVTLIGRRPHVDAIRREGLFLESFGIQQRIPLLASTDLEDVREAQIVLLCVKTPDTEDTARALAPHLAGGAMIVSLQNGVDNVDRIRSAVGIGAVPAVVYVAAQMTAPGCVKHTGRGDLIVGTLPPCEAGGEDRLERLAAIFERAGIPCQVSENIEGELWTKLIMNCAYNAISALSRAKYGRIVRDAGTLEIMRQATNETIAVGFAADVRFPNVDLVDAVFTLGVAMAGATSSTAQDIARGKRTEIDSLNGYVARRGAELGVPTPVNQTLYALVKLLEDSDVPATLGVGHA